MCQSCVVLCVCCGVCQSVFQRVFVVRPCLLVLFSCLVVCLVCLLFVCLLVSRLVGWLVGWLVGLCTRAIVQPETPSHSHEYAFVTSASNQEHVQYLQQAWAAAIKTSSHKQTHTKTYVNL